MLTAFTFPGQGAQYPHMLQEWPAHPVVVQTLKEAEMVLGKPLASLDSNEALLDSCNVQLSLLICGVVWGRYLKALGCQPDFLLGMSIGAYPAAVLSESLDFVDALKLVNIRGTLMQQAYPRGYGMMAVFGASRSQIETVLLQQQASQQAVFLANLNAEYQFILAGSLEALENTAVIIQSQTHSSSQLLNVTVPSHAPLLDSQAKKLRQAFSVVIIKKPKYHYVSAAKARVLYQADAIRDDLVNNMSTQVHWHDSSQMLKERGIQRIIEMPPGATLTNLCRRVFLESDCYSASNTNLDTLLYS